MSGFNEFFKNIAEKIGLPRFFAGTTLIFNNLFLTIVAILLVVALLLVIFLVPGKKKAKPASEGRADKEAEEQPAPAAEIAAEETPVQVPVEESISEGKEEEIPAEEPVPAEESAPVEESTPEEAQEETPVEAPAEEPVQEQAEAPAETQAEPAPVEEPEAKKEESKEEKAATKNGGKYEIVKRHGGYYFLLKANNGQLLLESSSYTSVQGVKNAIETFKNAVEGGTFSIDEDKNGNFKFILRNGARSQMLYHGESYSTRQSAENAIGSVKNFAFKAVVKRVEEADEDDEADSSAIVETKPLAKDDHKLGGKYEIVERSGSYYFLLKANNGQLLLESPAFTTESGAKSGIDSFKKAASDGIFMIDVDKNGNFRFILRASARSQMRYLGESYSTRQSAESSVHSVRAFAQKAVLK